MANRAQYKRKWVAAVRALRNADNHELSDSSYTELSDTDQQLPNIQAFNHDATLPQPETVVPIEHAVSHEEHHEEQHEEHVDYANHGSDHEMGSIGLNLSESSCSEVEVGDDDALGDDLAKWANDFQVKHNC